MMESGTGSDDDVPFLGGGDDRQMKRIDGAASLNYKEAMYKILKGAKGKGGDFTASGVLPSAPVCTIDIEEYGKLNFPVYEPQVLDVIKHFEQAPFGKGTETVVDMAVRNSYQLNPTKFKILHPQWDSFINDQVLPLVAKGFDIKNQIGATLYKLLLYKTGSFFKPHRDTEKENGMFGTLSVQLPSDYEGGELIVKHDGKTTTIDFSSGGQHSARAFSTFFSAFYCDCEHEVLPVRSGYRACLVYNLTSSKKGNTSLSAPILSSSELKLGKLLKNWPPSQDKLVFVLNHKYTEAELSFETLKTTDKVVATVLQKASEEHSFTLHLGLVEKHVCGQPEDDSGPKRNWVLYEPETAYSFNFIGPTNPAKKRPYRVECLDIDLSEVMPSNCFEGRKKPDEEKYEGYTGNCAGNLDRWYRVAALVFWPESNFFKLAKNNSCFTQSMILQKFLDFVNAIAIPKTDQKEENDAKTLALLEELLDSLGTGQKEFEDSQLGLKTLHVVSGLDRLDILQRMLAKFAKLSPPFIPFLISQCEKYGWTPLLPQLQGMLNSLHKLDAANLLAALVGFPMKLLPSSEKEVVLKTLVQHLLNKGVTAADRKDPDLSWRFYQHYAQFGTETEKKFLVPVFRLCIQLNVPALDYINSCSTTQILNIIGPALLDIMMNAEKTPTSPVQGHHSSFDMINKCLSLLEAALTKSQETSIDWKRSEKLHCSNEDCKALQEFLSSDRSTQIFKVGKMRRLHLHQHLENMSDITHETQRMGNPQPLVVTKTHVTAAVKERESLVQMIARMKVVVASK